MKVDLNFYQNEFNKIVDLYQQLKTKCKHIKDLHSSHETKASYCEASINQISNMLDETSASDINWFVPKRNKRALPLVLGGALLGGLVMGILPKFQADEYYEEFSKLHAKQQTYEIMLNKHTTLLQYAFEDINNLNKSFTSQIDQIKSEINDLAAQIYELWNYSLWQEKMNYMLGIQIDFNLALNHLTILIENYRIAQRQFLNTIATTHRNPSNPNVIPPKILIEELLKIKTRISSLELDLPFPIVQENLPLFYQIASSSTNIVNRTLLIAFSIPLISTKQYALYKSTSMPYRLKENLFAYIVPHYEYIALDKFDEKFVAITNDEISNCFSVDSSNIICKQTFPILSAIHTQTCEINLLRSLNVSSECNIRIANLTSELWIKLRKTNSYIYVFPYEQRMQIDCPNEKEKQFYNNSGIITFSPACTIKTDNIEIQAYSVIQTEIINEFIPSVRLNFNLTTEISRMIKFPEPRIPEINISNIVNFGEKNRLELISSAFDELKQLETQLVDQTTPVHFKSNIFYLSTVICFISMIIVIISAKLLYKHWLKMKRRRENNATNKANFFRNTPTIPSNTIISINPMNSNPQTSPNSVTPLNKPDEKIYPTITLPLKRNQQSIIDLPNEN